MEEESDILFIGNSATGENVLLPTSDELIQARPIECNVDHENQIEFVEFVTPTISDLRDTVDVLKQVRTRKIKKVTEKTPPRS